jgi:P27 family predicted phage terminase small subunit
MAKKTTKKKTPSKRAAPKAAPRPSRKRARPEQIEQTNGLAGLELRAEPLTETPPAPERLGEHGRACWTRIAPLLVEARVLTRLDLDALEALCHQWHDYLRWHLALIADPDLAIVEYESGARQKSPEATLRDAAYDRWLRLLPRFGLALEFRRKLKKLKEQPFAGARNDNRQTTSIDPVAEFARQKYAED